MIWTVQLILVALFALQPSNLLEPLPAQLNSILITGKVTSEDTGAPLANVPIIFHDSAFPIDAVEVARSDSSGRYTVTQTLMYSWWIMFDSPDLKHIPEYHNNTYSADIQQATVFTFTPGMVVNGVDAALAVRGQSQITGKVIGEPSGSPLENVYIDIYNESNQLLKSGGPTDSTGAYTVTELTAGGYKLFFNPAEAGLFYASEYYDNNTTVAGAELIQVGDAESVQGVDISLAAGGIITGYVTSSWTNSPVSTQVYAYDLNDQLVARGRNFYGDDGSYSVTNLLPGEYRLLMTSEYGEHRPEYYNDKLTLNEAQPVTVLSGEVTANVNAELTLKPTAVSIATSKALPNTIVLALMHDPAPYYTTNGGQHWRAVATTPWFTQDMPKSININISASVGLAPRTGLSERRILFENEDSMYRSGDSGYTWSEQEPLNTCAEWGYRSFSQLITNPIDPNRLYIIELCYIQSDLGGQRYYSLSVSNDAGGSWQALPVLMDGQELDGILRIVPSPLLPERIYVYNTYTGWYLSDDNGSQWVAKSFPVQELVIDGQNSSYLYGWSLYDDTPLYYQIGMRSEDGGDNWVEWAQQPCINYHDSIQFLAHPTETKMLFIRCGSGLHRSDNGGDEWKLLSSTPGQLLALDYGVPGRILWAKDDGIWASTDNGESWKSIMPTYALSKSDQFVPLFLPSVSATD